MYVFEEWTRIESRIKLHIYGPLIYSKAVQRGKEGTEIIGYEIEGKICPWLHNTKNKFQMGYQTKHKRIKLVRDNKEEYSYELDLGKDILNVAQRQ